MRSIVQDIQSEFHRFIERKDKTLLIIPCEPDHSALLLKSLEALDDDPESLDIFFIFGHPFAAAGQFIREIIPTLNLQLTDVNQELVKRGEPEFPPLTAELLNESQNPATRLAGLMQYVESLVTDERRVIWALYPLE